MVVVVAGLVGSVVCCVAQACGLALQRQAVAEQQLPLRADRQWVAGLVLFATSNVIGFGVAVATQPLIVVALLQSVSLVCNAFVSRSASADAVSPAVSPAGGPAVSLAGGPAVSLAARLAASAATLAGCVLVGTGPWDRSLGRPLDVLWARAAGPGRWWLAGSLAGAGLAPMAVSLAVCLAARRTARQAASASRRAAVGRGAAWAASTGLLAAHALLAAKAAVLALGDAWQRHSAARLGGPFALVVGSLAVLLAAQVCALQRALRCLDASVLYPLVICVYTAVSVVNAALLGCEPSTPAEPGRLGLGSGLVLLGILYLAWDQASDSSQRLLAEPNRTTVLSYASLRPLSMDSATSLVNESDPRNPVVVEENEGDTNYVSFHQRNNSDYGSTNNQARRSRLLSFEQEELLSQLV